VPLFLFSFFLDFVAYSPLFGGQVFARFAARLEAEKYLPEVVAFVKDVPYPVKKFLCEECGKFPLSWFCVIFPLSRLLTPPCFSSGVGSPFRAEAFVTEAYWDRFSVNLDLFVKQELYNSYRELGGFPQLFEIISGACGLDSDSD